MTLFVLLFSFYFLIGAEAKASTSYFSSDVTQTDFNSKSTLRADDFLKGSVVSNLDSWHPMTFFLPPSVFSLSGAVLGLFFLERSYLASDIRYLFLKSGLSPPIRLS